MKMTNNSGLPEAILRAMSNDNYSSGGSDYSATSLLKPARVSALERLHKDEIEEDAEDGLYRLYGQMVHLLLERANMADLAEKRFFINVDDFKVSAQIDTLNITDGILSDYKFTTSWGFKADQPPKPEWIAQLNIQLEILRQNGHDASLLQIIGLLRDWQLREARNNPQYPQKPIATLKIPVWPSEQTLSFIKMRIAEHEKAKKELPLCSPTEMWQKDPQYAVMKKGIKKAVKLHNALDLAEAHSKTLPGSYVQYRSGERVRCQSYCRVSKFCTQYQDYLKKDEK